MACARLSSTGCVELHVFGNDAHPSCCVGCCPSPHYCSLLFKIARRRAKKIYIYEGGERGGEGWRSEHGREQPRQLVCVNSST